MGRVVDHCFDVGGIVIELLGGDASIVVVKKLENDRDKWCYFSGDGFAKGGEVFGVDGLDYLLDEGSLEKQSL